MLAALLFASAGAAQTPVIVISVDTLRADHLSSYGYRAMATPNIDAFARHGTLFTDVNSQIPLTLPSHTVVFTSTYPFQNGVEENGQVVPPNVVTLASVLQSHGYKTAAFIGCNLLAPSAGLNRGFDDYDSPFGASTAASESPYSTRVRRDGALVVRAANQWLAAHKDQPVFVFVHLFDLHAPYKLRQIPGSALPFTAGYDAELHYVDQLLGRFTQNLMQAGWWQRSLIVLLADHGESLGDHGETSHGYFAYESTVHVPLIVHWPEGTANYLTRVDGPAGLIDVAPTILDAVHIPAPASFEGTSLMKFNGVPAHPIYSEAVYTRDEFGWAPLRAVRLGRFKFIEAPKAELYDLAKDPRELSNILRTNAAEVTTLRTELNKLLARYQPNRPAPKTDASSSTRSDLQSLGYLSGPRPNAAAAAGPDPKDRLAEYRLYEKAFDAYYAHRLDAAIADFRRLLSLDPTLTPVKQALDEAERIRTGK